MTLGVFQRLFRRAKCREPLEEIEFNCDVEDFLYNCLVYIWAEYMLYVGIPPATLYTNRDLVSLCHG